jgi:hypothetical protein
MRGLAALGGGVDVLLGVDALGLEDDAERVAFLYSSAIENFPKSGPTTRPSETRRNESESTLLTVARQLEQAERDRSLWATPASSS